MVCKGHTVDRKAQGHLPRMLHKDTAPMGRPCRGRCATGRTSLGVRSFLVGIGAHLLRRKTGESETRTSLGRNVRLCQAMGSRPLPSPRAASSSLTAVMSNGGAAA